MTTPDAPARPDFCWMDVKSRDPDGCAEFFTAVLGWRFSVDEDDWRKAVFIWAGEHRIGSVGDLANPVYPPDLPAHCAFYLAVDKVDRRTAAAVDHGARLVVPPFDAGGQGRMATLVDPTGAAFSLWQAKEFAGWSFGRDTAGAPHTLVHTGADPDAARGFYTAVLGAAPGRAVFAPSPQATASAWQVAVAVDDVAECAEGARAQGREPLAVTHPEAHPEGRQDRPCLQVSSPEGLSVLVVPR